MKYTVEEGGLWKDFEKNFASVSPAGWMCLIDALEETDFQQRHYYFDKELHDVVLVNGLLLHSVFILGWRWDCVSRTWRRVE